jgi:hypothetical protein
MQIRNVRSTGKLKASDGYNDLLDCRMTMLGLNLYAVNNSNSEAFEQIWRRCESCGSREVCAVDLKRDPNNPVWETYCPNSGALIALAESSWLID